MMHNPPCPFCGQYHDTTACPPRYPLSGVGYVSEETGVNHGSAILSKLDQIIRLLEQLLREDNERG